MTLPLTGAGAGVPRYGHNNGYEDLYTARSTDSPGPTLLETLQKESLSPPPEADREYARAMAALVKPNVTAHQEKKKHRPFNFQKKRKEKERELELEREKY